ncbi:unnamed protein product, partial [Amoebophrya sp. A25]|eukprot:GSA25T00024336001.1
MNRENKVHLSPGRGWSPFLINMILCCNFLHLINISNLFVNAAASAGSQEKLSLHRRVQDVMRNRNLETLKAGLRSSQNAVCKIGTLNELALPMSRNGSRGTS